MLNGLIFFVSFAPKLYITIKIETRSKTKRRREQQQMDKIQELSAKKDEIVEDPGLEDKTMKITQLNDDCLEQIFVHLHLEDLLNVALSNTRFHLAACLALKQKHSKKQMTIHMNYKSFDGKLIPTFLIAEEEDTNLRKFKNFMLIFGGLFSSIDFSDFPQYFKHIYTLYLPHLKTLRFKIMQKWSKKKDVDTLSRQIEIFLDLNPQLTTLDIFTHLSENSSHWNRIRSVAKKSQIKLELQIRIACIARVCFPSKPYN